MSRRDVADTERVDALLPCLSALNVNSDSTPVEAGGGLVELEHAVWLLVGDDEAIEAPVKKELIDPETQRPVVWTTMQDNQPVFDETVHKRLLWHDNAEWRRWYPPLPPNSPDAAVRNPGEFDPEYDYTNWTSWYPRKDNMSPDNPHWQRDSWTPKQYESLAKAREAFGKIIENSLKPLDGEDAEKQAKDLERLQKIMSEDAENIDSAYMKVRNTELRRLLEQNQPLAKRRDDSVPLPPGWLSIKTRIKPDSLMANILKSKNQKPGKYGELSFVGPQHLNWSQNRAYMEKTRVQAWLVYLHYQTSGSSNDPNQQAKRRQEGKPDPGRAKAAKTGPEETSAAETEEERKGPPSAGVNHQSKSGDEDDDDDDDDDDFFARIGGR